MTLPRRRRVRQPMCRPGPIRAAVMPVLLYCLSAVSLWAQPPDALRAPRIDRRVTFPCVLAQDSVVELNRYEVAGRTYHIQLERRGVWRRIPEVSWGLTGPWFSRDANYWGFSGYFRNGSTVILRGRPPKARFMNVAVYNERSTPVAMIRDKDLKRDAEGMYEIVIGREDPGAISGNWLDPGIDLGRVVLRIFALHGDLELPRVICHVRGEDGRTSVAEDPRAVWRDHGLSDACPSPGQVGWIQLIQDLERMQVDWNRFAETVDMHEDIWRMAAPFFWNATNPAYGIHKQLRNYRELEKRMPFIKDVGLADLYDVPGIENVNKDIFVPDPFKVYFATWYNVLHTGRFVIEGLAPPCEYFAFSFHDVFERDFLTVNDEHIAVDAEGRYRLIVSRGKPSMDGDWIDPGRWGVGDVLMRITYPGPELLHDWKRFLPRCRYE